MIARSEAKRMGVQSKMILVLGLILACCGIFGWFVSGTLAAVKVNGPYYKNIVQGKDLIADILPPPEYLLESYLNAFQLSTEREAQKRAALIEKSKATAKAPRKPMPWRPMRARPRKRAAAP